MSCPKCGSDNWKMASVIHAEGLSGISTSTFGVGVGGSADIFGGGVGLGTGVGNTNGKQQNLLSKLAAPPTIDYGAMFSFWFIGAVFLFSANSPDFPESASSFFGWMGIVFILIGFGGLKSYSGHEKELSEYQKKKMCLRCGTFFFGNSNLGASSSVKPHSKKCPFCAETIKSEAIICRFCQKEQPIVENVVVEEISPPAAVEARSTEELKQEIIRARKKGYSHYEISCEYNNDKDPLPKEYASQKKWSPSLVEQIENS